MRARFWLPVVTLVFLLAGCGSKPEKAIVPLGAAPVPAAKPMSERSEAETPGRDKVSVEPRKIIKEGSIAFETADMDETRKVIMASISKHGAYVAKDRGQRYGNRIEQRLVIRVPAENFDALLEHIANTAGRVESRSISLRDVTEEFVDVQARLRTKRELEKRYLELLKEARTVKDILPIEREIGKLREEIESVEGRLKYLRDRVSYSTLHVNFYQKLSALKGLTLNKLQSGFSTGWNNLMAFVLGLLSIWPFVILVVLGYYVIRRYRRKKREAKAGSA